jgi:hypothetical protein
MAAATSPEEVCNLALDLLRQNEKVEDLSDPQSDTESLAARWYDTTRRSVLRSFPWNFARTRRTLSLNGTAPSFGYANAYNLPADYLELVFVGENYNEDYETEYAVESGQILIDNDGGASLNICYIKDVTTVGNFDALFLDLLTAELAIRFANALTGINKSMKEIKDWRKELLVQARAKNGQETPVKRRSVSPILVSRRRVTSGGSEHNGTTLF